MDLVSSCLRPSKRRMPRDDEYLTTPSTLSPSSLRHETSNGEYNLEEAEIFGEEDDQKSMSTSSTPEECSPTRPKSILSSNGIQSPSRLRIVPKCTTKDVNVPLFYSPLSEGYQGVANSAIHNIPNGADLMDYENRWDYQSSLAGFHQQNMHVLDLSHRPLHPATLKFGMTPEMAQHITDFRFDKNFVGRHDLPLLLDLIMNLFPQLKHLTLKCEPKPQSIIEQSNEELNISIDEGRVLSADGSDDERSLGDAELLAKFDASIAMAQRENESIERLYLLYRIPSLASINGLLVTEEERNVARPDTPLGHKVKNYEWINHANLPIGSEMKLFFTDEQEDDCEEDGEFEVPLNSMIDQMRKGDSTPELLGSVRAERKRLSISSSTGSTSNACSNDRIALSDATTESKWLKSPRRSLLRMFPRTGKSIATKSKAYSSRRPSQGLPRIESSDTSKYDDINICNSKVLSDSSVFGTKDNVKPKSVDSDNSLKNSEVTTPSQKQNLDAFLKKGNSAIRHEAYSKIAVPRSDSTDVAIATASTCMSKMTVEIDPQVIEKENMQRNEHIKRGERSKNCLIGSMVKVKMKKRHDQTTSESFKRPPPSPASTLQNSSFRSFPSVMLKRKEVKNRKTLPSVSLVDNDSFDEDDDISQSDISASGSTCNYI